MTRWIPRANRGSRSAAARTALALIMTLTLASGCSSRGYRPADAARAKADYLRTHATQLDAYQRSMVEQVPYRAGGSVYTIRSRMEQVSRAAEAQRVAGPRQRWASELIEARKKESSDPSTTDDHGDTDTGDSN